MADPIEFADVPSPIGTFRIVYQGRTVRVVDLVEPGIAQTGVPPGSVRRRPPFPAGSPPRQLQEYFRRTRDAFDLDPAPESSSAFDLAVWGALRSVPCGRTITYGELARRARRPGSARAVGGAMHRNPIPVIIPCHRVVGADGAITGYGLGLWRKRWLLDREGAWPLRNRSAEGPRPRQRTIEETARRLAARRRRAEAQGAAGPANPNLRNVS
ncbi:MAG: methylated-DNA--[protein]-cysteine S-methyltransferase [Thermoplasmata archaeon]